MKTAILLACVTIFECAPAGAQKASPSCTVIDMSKAEGTFTIRDSRSGRIYAFKPDALEGAELKVGDSIDVSFNDMKVTAVKGTQKNYELLDAPLADSCCTVSKLDTAAADSLIVVIAKNNRTGEDILFHVPLSFGALVHEGNIVFTRPSHGYAMIVSNTDSTRRTLYGFPLLQETK